MQKPPSWDLSDLFSSIDDPKIEQILNESSLKAKEFNKKYSGKLDSFETATFFEIIKQYEEILSDVILPQAYGELIFTTDSTSAKYGAFLQKVKTKVTEIFSELIFFELEIGYFSEEKFEMLMQSEQLSSYKHYFERLLEMKPFKLSEKEERIIELKDLTGRQSIIRLFEQELSKQKFALEIEGKKVEMTQSEILNLLYTNKNQNIRQAAAKKFTEVISEKSDIFSFVTNTLAEDKKIQDKLRGFSFPEQARHLSNEADGKNIEAMCKVVEKYHNLVQEYYLFKKDVLGLEMMYDFDRYAPIESSGKKYSFEEAKEIVLDAFGQFDDRFAKIAKDFFDRNWIDAHPLQGKRGGAYCECASPQMHPYVFMNFTGSANDVMTLAHELGHAVHFELVRKQSFLNFHCPLTLAETASIFAETLTFSKLVSTEKDKSVLLGLYMQKIESIFASVHRQISMYRFEQDIHGEYRKNGELTKEQINIFWRKRQQQMFGDSVILTEDYDKWWMYIPHMVATPFYVYAYAFGELLAFGIMEKIKSDPQMTEKYLEFLGDAGLKTPQQLVNSFGINLSDEKFWESGMHTIKDYLETAKKLHLEK